MHTSVLGKTIHFFECCTSIPYLSYVSDIPINLLVCPDNSEHHGQAIIVAMFGKMSVIMKAFGKTAAGEKYYYIDWICCSSRASFAGLEGCHCQLQPYQDARPHFLKFLSRAAWKYILVPEER